jgi:hypothetical protein
MAEQYTRISWSNVLTTLTVGLLIACFAQLKTLNDSVIELKVLEQTQAITIQNMVNKDAEQDKSIRDLERGHK